MDEYDDFDPTFDFAPSFRFLPGVDLTLWLRIALLLVLVITAGTVTAVLR
jgi:hypothetical protein